jgi:bile acid:Na+ symporter, BASS family
MDGSLYTLIHVSVPVLNFILLTAVGVDLRPEDFARLGRQPALLLSGLAGPVIVLPPIALALTWLLRLPPEVAGALLLIAACPIGGISNTYSYLARASTALSVTLTGLSCLLAGITMPALGRLFGLLASGESQLTVGVPTLIGELVLMLTLPVGFGMWVRSRWDNWAMGHRLVVQRLAFAGVALVLALIVLENPRAFVGGLSTTVPVAAVFVVCSAAAGWATASLVTGDRRDRFTLAAEFGTRNLGVAMAVAVTLLGRIEFARFAYTYFLTELPIMLIAISWFRRRQAAAIAQAG